MFPCSRGIYGGGVGKLSVGWLEGMVVCYLEVMLSRSAVNQAAAWPVLTGSAPRDDKARADRNIPTGTQKRAGAAVLISCRFTSTRSPRNCAASDRMANTLNSASVNEFIVTFMEIY